MDRKLINRLLLKNAIAFVAFFLFYAYLNDEVTPFPFVRCLSQTLFTVLLLMMLDLLDYRFCLRYWLGKSRNERSGKDGRKA